MQAMQIDFNRALEGPPGSEYLLSAQMREYLARVTELFITYNSYKFRCMA